MKPRTDPDTSEPPDRFHADQAPEDPDQRDAWKREADEWFRAHGWGKLERLRWQFRRLP